MNNWFNNIRIYHLLIDRFNGGWQVPPKSENAFCGGNLQGVIEKLDYIKNLGFNAIMLSPIFKSEAVHQFVDDTEQSDDITMLAFRIRK